MRVPPISGLALVMCAAALWATVGVATELMPEQAALPRDVYGFVRTLIAGLALLLLVRIRNGWAGLGVTPGSLPDFLKFGVFCAIFQLCLFRSFELLGVTITVFLTVCLPPLITIGVTALRRTEGVSPHVLIAFALGALGLLAFVGSDVHHESRGSMAMGLGLSVAASVAFVLMTFSGRKLARRHAPLLIAGYGLLAAAAVLLPVVMVLGDLHKAALLSADFGWQRAGIILYLGLVPTAIAYVCFCSGMAKCSSATPGLVASMIEPGVAACLAYALLHEQLTAAQAMGCAVLLAAMIVLARGEALARPAAQNSRVSAP